MALIDSNISADNFFNLQRSHPSTSAIYRSAESQSIRLTQKGSVTSVKYNLKKYGSPTGNATAQIFAHSGTFGTSSIPTGSVLATSTNLDLSTLTTDWVTYELTFATPYDFEANTPFCITFINPASGVDESNYPIIQAYRANGTTHAGNEAFFYKPNGGAIWEADSGADLTFYVYGDLEEVGGSFLLNFV